MFGKLGDMAGMMKKAQEMQRNMKAAQEELAQTEVKGYCDGGKVEVVVTCDMTIKRINIQQECIETNDPEILEGQVLAAVNNAIAMAKNKAQEKMSEITGGIDIPGLG